MDKPNHKIRSLCILRNFNITSLYFKLAKVFISYFIFILNSKYLEQKK